MSGFDGIGATGGGPRFLEGRVGGELPLAPSGTEGEGEGGRSGFANALFDALRRVDTLQSEVRNQGDSLARGDGASVQDLVVAMGKSDVAFNLMLEVRNKILEAWQTLTRTVV